MSKFRQYSPVDHEAVSPVVGVILMVAVTVILSAIIGAFVTGLTEGTQETPRAGVTIDGNSDGSASMTVVTMGNADAVIVRHAGGEKRLTNVGEIATNLQGEITVLAELEGNQAVIKTAQASATFVSGTVQINPVIPDATVKAIGPNGRLIDSTTTDAQGNYTLSGSDFTNARILINVSGFDSSATTNPLYTSASLPADPATPVSIDFDKTKSFTHTVDGQSVSIIHRGAGTADNPHTIGNVHQLQAINGDRADEYQLIDTVDAQQTSSWNSGAGFAPIGTETAPFNGVIDGRNHTVAGLTIDRPTQNLTGLVGGLDDGATVKNVGVTSATVTGGPENVGILAGGISKQSVVQNAYATGQVQGTNFVGGLVGGANLSSTIVASNASGSVNGDAAVGGLVGATSGNIEDSSSTATVTASIDTAGGLAGLIGPDATVTNGSASGDVTGPVRAGGLVGDNNRGFVDESTASGTVVSSTSGTFSQAGGLAGESSGTIEDSSSTATVTGNAQNVGGLVGASFGDAGLINNSTASGDVNGAEDVGGLAGFNDAVVRASSSSSAVEGPLSVGGLVGDNRGLISSTTASGAVTANTTGSFSVAGGLVGFDNGTIERSVSTASVTGNKTRVGGLVAEQDSGSSINDSYAKGDVSGNTQVGGLVAFSRGTIEDSYASGSVSGASTVGGLMAFNDGATVTASYWDTAATGQSTSDGGTGLTTSEMQGSAAETNMDGFDFTNTWTTASGEYPGLQR